MGVGGREASGFAGKESWLLLWLYLPLVQYSTDLYI